MLETDASAVKGFLRRCRYPAAQPGGRDAAAARDLRSEAGLADRSRPARSTTRLAGETRSRSLVEQFVVPTRSGRAWPVRAGQLFRIVAVEGPQVADLNVWSLGNPRERFWASRTKQLHQAHVTTYDRLWSCLPYLRPMLTITNDTIQLRPGRGRRRLPRPPRHPLRPVRAQDAQRRGLRPLLPQQPRPRGRARIA